MIAFQKNIISYTSEQFLFHYYYCELTASTLIGLLYVQHYYYRYFMIT